MPRNLSRPKPCTLSQAHRFVTRNSAAPISPWRFLVDENLPSSLATELVALGHTAEHVYDLGMGGAKDPAVFAYAQTRRATIITGDKDYSSVRTYAPPQAATIVVEVPDTLQPNARKRMIVYQLATLSGQTFKDTLVIINPNRVRVRR
ncbi:MAG: DUF5615 family PIN-like protein [Ktedonobacterales bacterium]